MQNLHSRDLKIDTLRGRDPDRTKGRKAAREEAKWLHKRESKGLSFDDLHHTKEERARQCEDAKAGLQRLSRDFRTFSCTADGSDVEEPLADVGKLLDGRSGPLSMTAANSAYEKFFLLSARRMSMRGEDLPPTPGQRIDRLHERNAAPDDRGIDAIADAFRTTVKPRLGAGEMRHAFHEIEDVGLGRMVPSTIGSDGRRTDPAERKIGRALAEARTLWHGLRSQTSALPEFKRDVEVAVGRRLGPDAPEEAKQALTTLLEWLGNEPTRQVTDALRKLFDAVRAGRSFRAEAHELGELIRGQQDRLRPAARMLADDAFIDAMVAPALRAQLRALGQAFESVALGVLDPEGPFMATCRLAEAAGVASNEDAARAALSATLDAVWASLPPIPETPPPPLIAAPPADQYLVPPVPPVPDDPPPDPVAPGGRTSMPPRRPLPPLPDLSTRRDGAGPPPPDDAPPPPVIQPAPPAKPPRTRRALDKTKPARSFPRPPAGGRGRPQDFASKGSERAPNAERELELNFARTVVARRADGRPTNVFREVAESFRRHRAGPRGEEVPGLGERVTPLGGKGGKLLRGLLDCASAAEEFGHATEGSAHAGLGRSWVDAFEKFRVRLLPVLSGTVDEFQQARDRDDTDLEEKSAGDLAMSMGPLLMDAEVFARALQDPRKIGLLPAGMRDAAIRLGESFRQIHDDLNDPDGPFMATYRLAESKADVKEPVDAPLPLDVPSPPDTPPPLPSVPGPIESPAFSEAGPTDIPRRALARNSQHLTAGLKAIVDSRDEGGYLHGSISASSRGFQVASYDGDALRLGVRAKANPAKWIWRKVTGRPITEHSDEAIVALKLIARTVREDKRLSRRNGVRSALDGMEGILGRAIESKNGILLSEIRPHLQALVDAEAELRAEEAQVPT